MRTPSPPVSLFVLILPWTATNPRGFAWTSLNSASILSWHIFIGASSANCTNSLSRFVLFAISQASPELVGWVVG